MSTNDFDKLAATYRATFADAVKALRATGNPIKARTFETRCEGLIADWLRLAKAEQDDELALADPDALAVTLATMIDDQANAALAQLNGDAPPDTATVPPPPVVDVTPPPARGYTSRTTPSRPSARQG